jgi:ferredoxin
MKVIIDALRCGCSGYCERIAPGVFALPEHGPVQLLCEHPDPAQFAAAREARSVCPTGAIRIEEHP